MLPINDIDDFDSDFEEEIETSNTYAICGDRITGYIDGIEAIKQAVYLILNTERFEYIIYSWDYGVELYDLFGEPIDFVKSELKRVIKEALEQDERIIDVNDFVFEVRKKNILNVKFTVNSIFGDFESEKEVNF